MLNIYGTYILLSQTVKRMTIYKVVYSGFFVTLWRGRKKTVSYTFRTDGSRHF